MQVHDRPQGAPVLALAGNSVSVKRMQNHAPYACMAFLRKNGGISGDFLKDYCAASSARWRV
ncbi:acetyl xylan esterase [Cronobacter sakazakii]|uniref:acetyl xylan esterase n=1 Tax=Cronobacter sakazakii TaxID=28141 RepID=UPI000CF03B02|nr:acetyl xylan esterase [Cronobacter sakazakii]EGT5185915.1 acetyl xylan esterase [Cronobacter sakazakii]EGT5767686.1 acetyl xylan esterase [Cronobacter sakazakii]EJG0743890.1 acetyl xylan esterase [Cronobacter sakazakii]EJG0748768.1 acetyl xylan esterase [Cronobacter sakazakii]ELY2536085.1 acetyl xylan esterase [Cronobacter sakazakii]